MFNQYLIFFKATLEEPFIVILVKIKGLFVNIEINKIFGGK